MSQVEGDVLSALVSEVHGMTGLEAAPRLLRTAAVLVEKAGYEIARSERSSRVTQIILIAAELDRLGELFEKPVAEPIGESRSRRLDAR
ncbi:DNA primase [Citreicella sp. SE45]|nr:DNA primase [Citreicella sp. SE45]